MIRIAVQFMDCSLIDIVCLKSYKDSYNF